MTLVSGILKALIYDCPDAGRFLDSRLVAAEHLNCTSLSRKCLNPDIQEGHAGSDKHYVTMIANPWENKQTLCDYMFIDAFARKISLEYLDIPELYTFSEAGN